MSSKKKISKKRVRRTSKKKVRRVSKSVKVKKKEKRVHIFSDFDGTMVENTAALFVQNYVTRNPHHEPLHRRLNRGFRLVTTYMRRKYLETYYECLHRISRKERHMILSKVHVRSRWLRAVKDLRMKHRSKYVRLTIVTRNCIDVVHDWVMQNKAELHKHKIVVEDIIANGPLHDKTCAIVRERLGAKRVDYEVLGQLMEEEKKAFLNRDSIYIGDSEEEGLAPFVKEYVRI